MMNRRNAVLVLGAGLLAACQSGGPKASTVTVNLRGSAGMNPGPDGGDRPLTVLILRLKSTGAFNSADYFAMQGDPGAALGADLLGSDRVTVAPGGAASKTISVEAEATHVGFVALLREPGSRSWRAAVSISPGSTVTLNASISGGGISVSRG